MNKNNKWRIQSTLVSREVEGIVKMSMRSVYASQAVQGAQTMQWM